MTSIAEQVGRVVGGRYRLLAPVGTGASSQVYAASDTRLARRVAVKVLHPMLAGDLAFLRRFRAEARLAASLDHPHIMRVFDWGEEEEGPYLVLEFLAGGSLRGLLDTGVRLSHSQVAVLGAQAASGLAYAHRRGIVHRDIKPSNLLFDDDGHLRIGDFGVARALAESALTEPLGAIFGTARYASPEQAEGRPLDDRTDVYSLALVLYETLTGRVPFAGDTITAMLMARVGAILPAAPELGPLAPILAQAAISEPLARLDAAAIQSDLELLARELPPAQPLPLARPSSGRAPVTSDRDPTSLDAASVAAADAAAMAALIPMAVPDAAADDITLMGLGPEAEVPGAAATGSAATGLAATGLAAGSVVQPGQAGLLAHVPPVAFDPAEVRPARLAQVSADGGEAAAAGRDPGAPRSAADGPRRKHKRLRWLMLVLAIVLIGGGTATGLTLARQRADLFNHVVPRFTKMSLTSAENSARHAGLEAKETSSIWDAGVQAGLVIGQSIPPGRHERLHTVIGLAVSKGVEPVAVPSLATDSWVMAVRALTAAHLRHDLVHLYSAATPVNKVITWTHKGAKVPPSTIIQITVSEGPPPRKVPYVPLKDDWAEASKLLSAAGFVPEQLTAFSASKPKGAIISVIPNYSNGPEPYHTTVQVTFSKGPQYFQIPGDIVGMPLGQARAELEKDFVVKVYGLGTVLYVRPGAGSFEPQGSTVYLFAL